MIREIVYHLYSSLFSSGTPSVTRLWLIIAGGEGKGEAVGAERAQVEKPSVGAGGQVILT